MLNLDPAKLLIILVVALVVLGPDRLPHAARQLGTAWRTLTHLREQVTEEVRKAIPEIDLPNIPRPGSVTSFLTDLTRSPRSPNAVARPSEGQGGSVVEPSAQPSSAGRPSAAVIAPDDPSMN